MIFFHQAIIIIWNYTKQDRKIHLFWLLTLLINVTALSMLLLIYSGHYRDFDPISTQR